MQKHEDERITLLLCQNSRTETKRTSCNGIGRSNRPAGSAPCLRSGPALLADRWARPTARHGSPGTKTEAAEERCLGLACLRLRGDDDAPERLYFWPNFTARREANSIMETSTMFAKVTIPPGLFLWLPH